MNYLIVADESTDFSIVLALRQLGYEVYAIAESSPGLSDAQVLDLAFNKQAFLITEDKDFGELTYRFQLENHGILLIRMPEASSLEKAELIVQIIQQDFEQLWNSFSVIQNGILRIRALN